MVIVRVRGKVIHYACESPHKQKSKSARACARVCVLSVGASHCGHFPSHYYGGFLQTVGGRKFVPFFFLAMI